MCSRVVAEPLHLAGTWRDGTSALKWPFISDCQLRLCRVNPFEGFSEPLHYLVQKHAWQTRKSSLPGRTAYVSVKTTLRSDKEFCCVEIDLLKELLGSYQCSVLQRRLLPVAEKAKSTLQQLFLSIVLITQNTDTHVWLPLLLLLPHLQALSRRAQKQSHCNTTGGKKIVFRL